MPTLDEMRRWARGEHVKGLPKVEPKPEPKESKAAAPVREEDFNSGTYGGSGCKFSLNADRTDALLRFGMFRGHRVSDLVMTPRGRKYLRWIESKEDFEPDLRAVCRRLLEEYRRVKYGR